MNNKDKIKFIQFFQDKNYIDRSVQIKSFDDYDNYLDYYINEKLDPIKYLKTKIRNKLHKQENYLSQTRTLLDNLNLSEYVCVISPYYKDKKLDGYYKRVQQVDEEILNNFKSIYLDFTELGNRQFIINHIDEKHIEIKFNSFNDRHLECIKQIIDSIKKVYIHSVHELMPDTMNYQLMDIIFNKDNKTILDLHGAVSEELKQFDSLDRAKMAEFIEDITIDMADKVVCMSQAMAEYYTSKYNLDPDKFITMSIMPFKELDNIHKQTNDIPVVVYAGGIQKWQNIDLIKETIKNNINDFKFKIFTHDSNSLKSQWQDIQSDNLLIDTRNNEDIYKEYENCDFGFILRDDNIVNNVACPTKLMEYIRFGIIPILKSDNIGSFKKYGLKYISINDFNKNNIPDLKQRQEILENNYKILSKIIDISNNGQKEIIEYLK